MNPNPSTDATANTGANPATPLPAPEQPINDRLCHLFRTSLKSGRIHPLYLPILKYRHAQRAS